MQLNPTRLSLFAGALSLLLLAWLAGCGGGEDGPRLAPTCEVTGCAPGFVCVGQVCLPDSGTPDVGVDVPPDADDVGADVEPSDSGEDLADVSEGDDTEEMDLATSDADATTADDTSPDTAASDVHVDVSVDLPPEGCVDQGCPGLQVCNSDSGLCEEGPVCVSDLDCLGERGCLRGTCVSSDELPECRDDGECPQGQSCAVALGECGVDEECTSDAQCVGSERCDVDGFGFCVECLADADCPGAQTCQLQSKGCVEPAACSDDQDCQGARVCQGAVCEDPTCVPDAFEPNDAELDATSGLVEGPNSVTLCDAEDDWYAISVNPGDGMIVQADYDPLVGALDLELTNTAGWLIGGAVDTGGHPVLILGRSLTEDPYLVHVRSLDGVALPYTLQLDTVAGGVCIDDEFEPNRTRETAASLPTEEAVGATLCLGSDDWFVVSVPADTDITVNVASDGGGPVAAALYENGEAILRDTQPQEEKVLQAHADSVTDYLIEVYPIDDASEGDYVLEVHLD